MSRLDLIADRVDRLDQAMSDYGIGDRTAGSGRFAQITQEIEEVHAKIEDLRADLEGEARIQRDKITSDLRSLEGVDQAIVARFGRGFRRGAHWRGSKPQGWGRRPPSPRSKKIEAAADEEDLVAEAEEGEEFLAEAETVTVVELEEKEELILSEDEPPVGFLGETERKDSAAVARAPEPDLPEAADIANIGDSEMLEILSQAIEAGRVDLYLQPTVTLPERRPRYLEAFTRIRTKTDSLIRPRSYLPAAESSGMMPLIDNVLLVKSVQTLRRLGPDFANQRRFLQCLGQHLARSRVLPRACRVHGRK